MNIPRVFTPRLASNSNDRLTMTLSDDDWAKVRRGRWRATITDTSTGLRYKVRGAACSIPNCFCDAVVVARLVEEN